mmetsp:Transcript_31601/g.58286  ORF Transcript_31601/g.58286 Transcript_31601/m.58286 type:complete len:1137 (+) Transcript_31601:106-3516(+)
MHNSWNGILIGVLTYVQVYCVSGQAYGEAAHAVCNADSNSSSCHAARQRSISASVIPEDQMSILQTDTRLKALELRRGAQSEAAPSEVSSMYAVQKSAAGSQGAAQGHNLAAKQNTSAKVTSKTEVYIANAEDLTSNANLESTKPHNFSKNATAGNSTRQSGPLMFKSPTYLISVFAFFVVCSAAGAFAHYFTYLAGDMLNIALYTAEFAGTFCIVFTAGCCELTAASSEWTAVAVGLVMMVMVYATFPISGSNLNPAVSLSLGIIGKMRWPKVLRYCALQICAGVLASFCCRVLLPEAAMTQGLQTPFAWWHGALAEIIYTMMMCLVFAVCTACKRNNSDTDGNQFYGVAIGFALITGGYVTGKISGSTLNPAVSLGFEMITRDAVGWGFAWTVFECLGACLAAWIYRSLRLEDFHSEEEHAMYVLPSWTKYACEFLGTAFLVLTIGLAVITASPAVPFAAAGALICTSYAFREISGAHFNPAVTLAVVMGRPDKISVTTGFGYIVVQCVAGSWAGLLTTVFVGSDEDIGKQSLSEGHSWLASGIVECFFTAVVAYVVLSTAMSSALPSQASRQNFYFALCLGLCYASGSIAASSLSAGHLSPAVSTGRLVMEFAVGMTGNFSFTWALLYVILFQVAGGAAASIAYRTTHAAQYPQAPRQILAMSPFVAEFVGTFTLTFTAGCCTLGGHNSQLTPIVLGSMLMAMMYSCVPISGGHLNPAVSVSVAVVKNTGGFAVLGYGFSQVAAGIVASWCCSALFVEWHSIGPVAPFSWMPAGIVELVYTFLLCFVFNNCWVSKRNNPNHDGNQFFALAVGFVLIAGGYAARNISGACFNPAVSLGFGTAGRDLAWGMLWSCFQVAGALISALLFQIVRPEESMFQHEVASYEPSLGVKCLCEFLGSFILVFTVGLNLITMSAMVALSSAALVICMIYALHDISGAHYNPAITLAVMMSGRGKCPPSTGMAYLVVQLMAGALAGHLYAMFHAASPNHNKVYDLHIGAGYNSLTAGAAELFFTAVIVYIFLATATVRPPTSQKSSRNSFFGLCVGSCVTLASSAIGKISGAVLNPAVCFGISFANFSHSDSTMLSPPSNCIPFSLWELSGGVVAAVVFQLTHTEEYNGSDILMSSVMTRSSLH